MSWESRKPCSKQESPTTGDHEYDGIVYGLAESRAEQQAVVSFWHRQFEEKSTYLKGKPEATINNHSFIHYARARDRIVAACRLTRKAAGGWEVGDGLPDDIALEVDSRFRADDFLQLNRVSVDSAYRKLELHLNLFGYCARWVQANAGQTGYFAVCQPALIKLYKGLGASIAIERPFPIAGRGDRRYYLLSGQVSDAISRLGTIAGGQPVRDPED